MGGRPSRPPAPPTRTAVPTGSVRHGLARVLSKAGLCSRTDAAAWIRDGRVRVDGRIVRDPEYPIHDGMRRVSIDGLDPSPPQRHYLMLNKPRGLVTTRHDPEGRPTVFDCLGDFAGAHLSPVGRLDKASEGLLLFTNDTEFSNALLDPATHGAKT